MEQQRQNRELDLQMYREQVRADELKQRRTADLIKGISALGAGFAL